MNYNPYYSKDIKKIASIEFPWNKMQDKVMLITGATGLLGKFLVDVIMYKNNNSKLNCRIIAMGRNEKRAIKEFGQYLNTNTFSFISHDINEPLNMEEIGKVDYVLHLASNTHPRAYATDPIGTITANIIGTKNMLDFCVEHNAERFLFASSNEIYGENRGDVDLFDEEYCGYIDSNTLRAGYPESKRCGESLCQAYMKQKGLDVVVPRFTRSYGPTMLMSDTKAISQFIINGVKKEDIVLKSLGKQNYSYTYVADAISGLLYILLLGKKGEAYNIADVDSNITLRKLAEIVADITDTKVIYETPDDTEKAGYSKATKALLDGKKLRELGWNAQYDMRSGLENTISFLRNNKEF